MKITKEQFLHNYKNILKERSRTMNKLAREYPSGGTVDSDNKKTTIPFKNSPITKSFDKDLNKSLKQDFQKDFKASVTSSGKDTIKYLQNFMKQPTLKLNAPTPRPFQIENVTANTPVANDLEKKREYYSNIAKGIFPKPGINTNKRINNSLNSILNTMDKTYNLINY